MIDGDDVSDAWLFASMSTGGFGVVALIIAIVVSLTYCNNKDECSHMHCANGKQPKLMEHECLCVERAR